MEQLLTQSHHTGTVSAARDPHPCTHPPPHSLKPGPGGSVTVRYSDLNPARPTHIEPVQPIPLRFSILPIPAPPSASYRSIHIDMERQYRVKCA